MYRPQSLGKNGLPRLMANAAPRSHRRSYTTDGDVETSRRYCLAQLQTSDYDAHLIRRFVPPRAQDTYTALRALNLELVRLPEMVAHAPMRLMRINFWQESIEATFAGRPPREPMCTLLHEGLGRLDDGATRKSIKFWVSRLVKTRAKQMDDRPFATLASLEDHAENTYSTMMYATLASMPLRSLHVDHLASHIGKACGIVAVLRGVPVLASSGTPDLPREPRLLLPLDVLAEEGVKEEDVFRQGPRAQGLQDAVFRIATRANDHLITAREMLNRLRAGQDPGHDFEHEAEGEHLYDEEADAARDVRRAFGVLLEAVPAAHWLRNLEKANFDPFAVRSAGWRLPWSVWQALSKERI